MLDRMHSWRALHRILRIAAKFRADIPQPFTRRKHQIVGEFRKAIREVHITRLGALLQRTFIVGMELVRIGQPCFRIFIKDEKLTGTRITNLTGKLLPIVRPVALFDFQHALDIRNRVNSAEVSAAIAEATINRDLLRR